MKITNMYSKKSYWIGIAAIVIVVLAFAVDSQTATIESATLSPEVVVKGQSQVTMDVTLNPKYFFAPKLRAVMAEQGYNGNPTSKKDWLTFFTVFKLNRITLGNLTLQGKDSQGNYIYKGTFVVNVPEAKTVQIQPTNIFGMNLLKIPHIRKTSILSEEYTIDSYSQPARLAITTRTATLPPDPGDAGNANLEGLDSDHDGLRDEVQREIMYLASGSEKLRAALGQYARALQQQSILSGLTDKQAFDLEEKSKDGGICIYAVNPSSPTVKVNNYALQTVLANTILNTSSRKQLQEKNLSISGNHDITSEMGLEKCSFNPSDYQD